MDAVDYITTISSNSYNDWIRCHNDLLHNIPHDSCKKDSDLDEETIKIISHLLKVLYNEKIITQLKCCLLISVEENLDYFVKSENGAVYFFQSLLTDFKNKNSLKYDSKYLCQVITLLTNVTVYYDLPTSSNPQCSTLIDSFLFILFDLCSKSDLTHASMILKHLALSSLFHFESFYPTLLYFYEAKIVALIESEKSIFFDTALQLHSLVFKNCIKERCRLQHSISQDQIPIENLETKTKLSERLMTFKEWNCSKENKDKLIGHQSQIFKALRQLLDQATQFLTPLAVNRVVINCLEVVNQLMLNNRKVWINFLKRYIRSSDLNILAALYRIKQSKVSVFENELLQETFLSVMNNTRIIIHKRLMAAHWLYYYPIKDRQTNLSSDTLHDIESQNQLCKLEPEFSRGLYLRSFDTIEIKYNKLMQLGLFLKCSAAADSSSALIFSSMKNLIKSVQYYDTGISSYILLRVMFAIHVRQNNSVLVFDFENILENLAIKNKNNLMYVVAYLSALNTQLGVPVGVTESNCDGSRTKKFSSRCLNQIVQLSNERLVLAATISNSGGDDYSSKSLTALQTHLQVLMCCVQLCDDISLSKFLKNLLDILTSNKMDLNIEWLEKAYEEVLQFCFEFIKYLGCWEYYNELVSILFEIYSECKTIKGKFLYILVVSLPSRKVREIIQSLDFNSVTDKSFNMISEALVQNVMATNLLNLDRQGPIMILDENRFHLTNGFDTEEYFNFLDRYMQTFVMPYVMHVNKQLSHEVVDLLIGVEIEFESNSQSCSLDRWVFPIIYTDKDFPMDVKLTAKVTYPESFQVTVRLSATKMDGTFVYYNIAPQNVKFMDLCLPHVIDRTDVDDESCCKFVHTIIEQRLKQSTFISVNFEVAEKYYEFQELMSRFYLCLDKSGEDDKVYMMLLPRNYHIVIFDRALSAFYRLFEVFTDLTYSSLIEVEDFFRNFN